MPNLSKNKSARCAFIAMSTFTSVMLTSYIVMAILFGPCPNTEPMDKFEVAKYKGTWYELQRDKDISFETGTCVTATYGTDSDNADYVSVDNTQYFPATDSFDKINGYAAANSWFPGWINVYFFASFGANYRVMATDYDDYAIVYSCTTIGPFKYPEFSWLLARDPLVEGSAAWNTLIAKVEPLYKEWLPDYDRAGRMVTTGQGGSCKYSPLP